MSTFGTYIKTNAKKFQYSTPSAGSFTVDVFTASDFSYIDVEYIKVIGNSAAGFNIIDITTGIQLSSYTQSSGGGGINVALQRGNETMGTYTSVSGTGGGVPKSLRIPNGCKLQAVLTDVAPRSNSIVAVGIEFANTQ